MARKSKKSGGDLGFETKLFRATDKTRNRLLPKLMSGEILIGESAW